MPYNRQLAANYAMKWALKRNPDFPDYSSAKGGGGDCSNFISQSLHAGGYPMNDGWGRRIYAWWTEKKESSRTWSSSKWLSEHIDEFKKATICLREDLDLGDLVSINMFGYPIMHWMMITGMRSGVDGVELLFCGHSTDRLNYPLAIAEAENSGRTILYWKVAERFNSHGYAGATG